MPRPQKKGLDYFPHDCDASHDEKIESICEIYGFHIGYSTVFRLFERIYRAGGYLDISAPETIQMLSRKVAGMDESDFEEFLKSCVNLRIFEKDAFESGVLTSEGIRKRCHPVLHKRKKMAENYQNRVSEPFLLQDTYKEKKRKEKKRKEEYKSVPSGPTESHAIKKFTKPTLEEIAAYCEERHNDISPQKFFDHYESVGWVIGKDKPMKDWKAAVRTWESRDRENKNSKEGHAYDAGDLLQSLRENVPVLRQGEA